MAFAFNALVTALVFRRVFSPGPVNAQRVQGAVLLYLNVAVLFPIAYGVIETHLPGSFVSAGRTMIGTGRGVRTAALSYFSLTTITTTGFGDLAPIHPLARSLANLEGVFGQLYPATLLARLFGYTCFHMGTERTLEPFVHRGLCAELRSRTLANGTAD